MASSTPRDRFVGWLRWYMDTHPTIVPTRSELARRLGVAKSVMTPLFATGSHRAPSFDVLVAAHELTGLPVDVMLFCEPPEADQSSLPLGDATRRRA